MRTVEFKLHLNQTQQQQIQQWLNVQRWVWNEGLRLLEEFTSMAAWDKVSQQWVPCCPLPWEYYKDATGQLVPFARLAQSAPYRLSCPLPRTYRQPELESPTFFSLASYFTQKRHSDKPWFCAVPSKFVGGTLKSLADAWAEYKSGKRQRPRYKQYKDKIKTLVNNNAKSVTVSGNQITLPKLGKVRVKTLDKRWLESVSISVLKIVKEPSGFYLLLTAELPTKKLKPSHKAVGMSLGYSYLAITDGEKVIEPPRFYRKIEKRLTRLQRQHSRQQKTCPISTFNPELGEHFLSCPVVPHKGANQAKTQQKISRLHEKLRRSRRAFNHKLSTSLVREYGGITTVKPEIKKITRRPKPIVNKAGTGYDLNGANRKAQFNKGMLDNGLGQLTTLIKQKAVVHGREFIEFSPKDLQLCYNLDTIDVGYTVEACGQGSLEEPDATGVSSRQVSTDEPRQDDRGIEDFPMLLTKKYRQQLRWSRAVYLASFKGRYRPWGWELTPGESIQTLNQEASTEAPPRGTGTTSTTLPATVSLATATVKRTHRRGASAEKTS